MFMAKKLSKIWLSFFVGIMLVLAVFVMIDRHRNIRHEGTYQDKAVVYINDSWFVNIPFESGLDLSTEGFTPVFAYVYADSLNPVFKTLNHPSLYFTDWVYHTEHGEPAMFMVYEQSDWDLNFENPYANELSVFDAIDDTEISYCKRKNNEFVLCLKKENRTIVMVFSYSQLDELKAVLEKAWDEIRMENKYEK